MEAEHVPDDTSADGRQVESGDDCGADERDMKRLGKSQELKRRFRFSSICGYVIVLGLTWEFSIVTSVLSLGNGGTAGTIWLSLVVICGVFTVMLSLAELASISPTSGGQYHWVSEFAPRSLQKPLSFAVGWLVALGWQATMPEVAYIGAQQVVALIVVCNPRPEEYVYEGWHGALLTMAFVLSAIFFNTSGIGKIPILEGLAVGIHAAGFVAFLAILWALGPRASAKETFTSFRDDNGWGSAGLATMVGMIGPTTTYLGSDSAVHLAEELQDASYMLPRAMFCACIINYILGFIMTVTFMFNLGNIEDAIVSSTGQPWVYVIQTITGSKAATIVLVLVMIIMYFFCAVNQVTTSSRQVFSFARDKGLPFSTFLSKVNSQGVPINSVYLTLAFTCLMALIIIGSATAFNIILSVAATGLYTSYVVVIGTVLARKLSGIPLPRGRFDLGKRLGIVINTIAVCFLSVAYVFLFFPNAPHPDAAGMNWAILIYGVAVLFGGIYYFLFARHVYDGPVAYVRDESEVEM